MEEKTEQIIFYVMQECGCRITADSLEHQSSKTSARPDSRVRVCREHSTLIDHRESYCTVCGDLFSQSKSGQMSAFCPVCRIEHHREAVAASKIKKQMEEAGASMQDPGCPRFNYLCDGKCILNMFPGLPCAMFIESKKAEGIAA